MADEFAAIRHRWSPQWVPDDRRWQQAMSDVHRLLEAVRDEYSRGYDEGRDAIWDEVVCSVCGHNHDRDESAMCVGGDVVSFRDWVESKRG